MHLTKTIDEKEFNSVSPLEYLMPLDIQPGMVVAFRYQCPDKENSRRTLYYEKIAVVTVGRPLFLYKIGEVFEQVKMIISTKTSTHDRKFALRMAHANSGKRYELPLMIDPATGEMLNLQDMPYGYLVAVAVKEGAGEFKRTINNLKGLELGREGRSYGDSSIKETKPKPIEKFEQAKARSRVRAKA